MAFVRRQARHEHDGDVFVNEIQNESRTETIPRTQVSLHVVGELRNPASTVNGCLEQIDRLAAAAATALAACNKRQRLMLA